MRRVNCVVSVSAGLGAAESSHLSSSSAATTNQARFLRNLHQNRQERSKSLLKNRHILSRKWRLEAGNNWDLHEEKGHEREAFQNFARYNCDWGKMSIPLYVSDMSKLPPKARYDMLYNIVQERKGLSAFMKNKYLLDALECFVEMKNLGELNNKYDNWETLTQNHFLYVVDEIMKHSRAYVKVQHSAVASVLRAAAICDEIDCREKRNMCLSAAEHMAGMMDSQYPHAREGAKLSVKRPWEVKYFEKKILDKMAFKEANGWVPETFEKTPGKMEMGHNRDTMFRLNHYPFVPHRNQRQFYQQEKNFKLYREIE